MEKTREKSNDKLARTAQHALSCGRCKIKAQLLARGMPVEERYVLLCAIEEHEMLVELGQARV